MELFIQFTDLDVWDVILDGPKIPSIMMDGKMIPKHRHEWDERDRQNIQLNARAIYMLQCAIDRNEYNRVCQCKSA